MNQEKNPNTILAAGYSHHRKPFQSGKSYRQNRYLIRLQVSGTCEVTLNGTSYAIAAGDIVFVKPGDDYRLRIDEDNAIDSTDYYLSCKGGWISSWWKERNPPPKANIEAEDSVLGIWRRLVYEKRNIREDNGELLDYLSRTLCLLLSRQLRNRSQGKRQDTYIPYQIKQYVERRATEPLTLNGIAQHLGVSVSSASHLFKQTFRQPIMRYLVEVRLSIAAERMLVSRLKLEDIAEAAGFRSYPYFCRAFRARFGVSPRDYRSAGHKL